MNPVERTKRLLRYSLYGYIPQPEPSMKPMPSLLLALALCTASIALAADAPKYQLTNRFAVAGEGGWDYLTYDAEGSRLFITRGTHVMVLDPATGKSVGDIPETLGVHGVALAPDLGLGATSNGRANTVSIFDLKTLQKKSEVKTGSNPDAVLYDAASHLLFTFNGRSNDATVIDPVKSLTVATIPLGGKPEFAATDERGHIFVNIEDKNQLAAIDTKKLAVSANWPLTGCDSPTGLAIDIENGRLFSVCANKVMTVVDSISGKLVTTVPIGNHPDAAAFDPATHLVFSSNGEGTLTVIHQESPDKYTVLQTVPTAPSARTMTLDPKSHTVYLVTAKFGSAPAPSEAQPHPRPTMLPGSFELLVVSAK
jgi:DNA-binding beta-propeller fold protein YncE